MSLAEKLTTLVTGNRPESVGTDKLVHDAKQAVKLAADKLKASFGK